MFVTDLDGTLLTPQVTVDPVSAGIVSNLSLRGAMITTATARTPATLEPILENVYTSIPLIVMTGAAFWDRAAQRFIDPKTIPAGMVPLVLEAFKRHGVSPFVYALGQGVLEVYHSRTLSPGEEEFVDTRRELPLKHFNFVDRVQASDLTLPAMLIFGVGPHGRIAALARSLSPEPFAEVPSYYRDVYNPGQSFIEVFAPGVSKASAIERLKERVGAERVIAYGDNYNDLPMFRVADQGVAVANAVPDLIAAATRVIGPNTEPSVAMDMLNVVESGEGIGNRE